MAKDDPRGQFTHLTRRTKINIVIALLVSAVTTVLIVLFTINEKTIQALGQASVFYMLAAFLLTLISYFLSGLTFNILAQALGKNLTIWQGFEVFTGANFIGLTAPFHVANVPVQAYFLNIYGIPYADAVAIVATHAILSGWFFVVFAPLAIVITELPLFGTPLATVFFVALLTMFVLTLLFVIFIVKPSMVEKLLALLFSNRLVKRFVAKEKIDNFCHTIIDQTKLSNKSLRFLFRHAPFSLIIAYVTQVFSWLTIIATVPIILIALNWTEFLPDIFFRVLVLNFFLPFSPIPGGSGIAEFGIFAALLDLVPSFLIAPVVILWRFTTFYLIYAISGFFFVLLISKRKNGKSKGGVEGKG